MDHRSQWARRRGEIRDPKPCTRCEQVKNLSEYGNSQAASDGHASECKECAAKRQVERYRRNKATGGLCHCGRPVIEGLSRCESCRASVKRVDDKRRAWRKAHNLCRQCGVPVSGFAWCESCAARNAARHHGGTLEVRKQFYSQQNGICPVCVKPLDHFTRQKFAVIDHDHITGKIRGLLHNTCNGAIGMLGDDPVTLRAAAAYLEGGVEPLALPVLI